MKNVDAYKHRGQGPKEDAVAETKAALLATLESRLESDKGCQKPAFTIVCSDPLLFTNIKCEQSNGFLVGITMRKIKDGWTEISLSNAWELDGDHDSYHGSLGFIRYPKPEEHFDEPERIAFRAPDLKSVRDAHGNEMANSEK